MRSATTTRTSLLTLALIAALIVGLASPRPAIATDSSTTAVTAPSCVAISISIDWRSLLNRRRMVQVGIIGVCIGIAILIKR